MKNVSYNYIYYYYYYYYLWPIGELRWRSSSEKRIFVWASLWKSMKVHKSENILPRFIAISVIPTISKKSGRAGICHSLCDRFLGKILLFHMAVRASRLTYATNYYFGISDRLSFLYQELPIPVSREIVMQKLSSIISTKWKYRWPAARKIMQKKNGCSEPRYIIVFVFFRVTLHFSLPDCPRDGY